jgi:hypothetical protein
MSSTEGTVTAPDGHVAAAQNGLRFDVWRVGYVQLGEIYNGIVQTDMRDQCMNVVTDAVCRLPYRYRQSFVVRRGLQGHAGGDPRCYCGIHGCVNIGDLQKFAVRLTRLRKRRPVIIYRALLTAPLRSTVSDDPLNTWRGSRAEIVAPLIFWGDPVLLDARYGVLPTPVSMPGSIEAFKRLREAQPAPSSEPCGECRYAHDHAPDCRWARAWWC